jgi:hypothetical protein
MQTLILWIVIPSLSLTGQISKSTKAFNIDSFSTFPADGCSCYFANDSIEFKKQHYIYANDCAQMCYLKIDGILIELTQTDFNKNYGKIIAKANNDLYDLTIKINKIVKYEYETVYYTGIIQVSDKHGHIVTKSIYGLCGE